MQAGGGGVGGEAADLRGRHRIQAELKKLEQEARFLEEAEITADAIKVKDVLYLQSMLYCSMEELVELEKADKVSSALQEFLTAMETKADPLLPVSTGPVNQSWDKWFEGPQDLRGCKCWFL